MYGDNRNSCSISCGNVRSTFILYQQWHCRVWSSWKHKSSNWKQKSNVVNRWRNTSSKFPTGLISSRMMLWTRQPSLTTSIIVQKSIASFNPVKIVSDCQSRNPLHEPHPFLDLRRPCLHPEPLILRLQLILKG